MTFFKTPIAAAFCAALVLGLLCSCPSARAQEDTSGLIPSGSTLETETFLEEETHPPLRLTPDRSEILTLGEDIERVIIGNETHLNILMDTTNRIVIVPRIPGATFFTLLGENGKVIMQRYAIIAAPEEKYVRIRQPCGGQADCMPIRMFYCPDMCHEVGITGEGNTSYTGSMTISDSATSSGSTTATATSTEKTLTNTGSETTSGEK